jgi:hypothetical protein
MNNQALAVFFTSVALSLSAVSCGNQSSTGASDVKSKSGMEASPGVKGPGRVPSQSQDAEKGPRNRGGEGSG